MIDLRRRLRQFRKRLGGQQKGQPAVTQKYTLPGAIFVSFPKSGRTWIRVMLDHLGISLEYYHANSGHRKRLKYEQLGVKPTQYAKHKVILMIRDPRDVVVSGYFQATKREKIYSRDISHFIRDSRHGIEKIIRYNNLWLGAAENMQNILVVRYEDCHVDAAKQLKRIVQLLGRDNLSDDTIDAAVEFAKFENMRRREAQGAFEEQYGAALTATESTDPESYKTRRGKVGGFADYLSQSDVDFCSEVMVRLNSEYSK